MPRDPRVNRGDFQRLVQGAPRLVQEKQASGVGLVAAIMRIHLPVYLAVGWRGWLLENDGQGKHMIFRAHF